MSFVHLHVHSEYSLLDGFSNLTKLVECTKNMGMPAVALTDHGTMYGVIDFYNAAIDAGVKPIIGLEAYLATRGMASRDPQHDKKSTHLLLLAENATGYQNLLRIASAAQLNGFYYYPRIDHEFLGRHTEGLICTSGCMSAEIPRLIQQGDLQSARKQLDWYYEAFGPNNFFLELQQHDVNVLEQINKHLMDLGRRYESRFVATNDVHYINPEDARLQDIMLAIQTGCLLSDPNRMRMTDNSYYLRSPEEMGRLFAEIPQALSNTLRIAERCNLDLGFKDYHLPHFTVPPGYTTQSYLKELCEAGASRRYGLQAGSEGVQKRLKHELDVIHKMGFDTYFLIVWDLCRYSKEQGIWYNARGSAAGSIVAYSLDITLVDPIEHGLIFERFLNPGRISMPDIDLDFRDDRRADMIEYATQKYGEDKVAQIITFGTMGARAAIRDVGRVMDIPLSEVDRVAKLIPNIPGKPVSIEQALVDNAEFKQLYQTTPYLRDLIDTAKKMEGVVRSAGTHAAGVIIADKPIIEYLPLHRPTGSSVESPVKMVTQFEMSVLDSLGLLKVDFLGLATLTIMAKACDLIFQRHSVKLDLDNIPTNDPAVYDLMGRGDTAGVFQVEGSGMRRYLMQMKPKELANVIAMVALFRPGPMDFIPAYIRRMHGEEKIEYRHPMLEPIFKETFGYPVYQEQLMLAVMNLAGYSAPDADDLRKAISKKLKDKLLKHREKFINGAINNGIDPSVAGAIFDDWEEFARYGFNKSHAVDYGVIAVQTAYLKAHFPVEYMTAVLSVNKNDTSKVALYVADCRRLGIEVKPPDVNISDWDFSIEDRTEEKTAIRFGLGAVKNVGQSPVDCILKAREGKPFNDLNEFARRVDLRQVGKRALESLIKVGALDNFGSRTALLEVLDRVVSVSASHYKAVESGQISLFGVHTGVVEEITLPPLSANVNRRDVLDWERELLGLYVSDHPLSPVMTELTQAVSHFSGQLAEANQNEKVRVAGMITRIRNHQSKTGKSMAFVTLEDVQGSVELVVFPRIWELYSQMMSHDRIVLVDGRVDNNGAEPKVLVDSVTNEFSTVAPLISADPESHGFLNQLPTTQRPTSRSQTQETKYAPPGGIVKEAVVQKQAPTNDMPDHQDRPGGEIPPPPDAFPPNWAVDRGTLVVPPFLRPVQETGIGIDEIDESEKHPDILDENEAVEEDLISLGKPLPVIFTDKVTTNKEEFESAAIPLIGHTTQQLDAQNDNHTGLDEKIIDPVVSALPPYLIPPATVPFEEGTVHMVTVILRPTGDKTRDVLRLRRIHGIITSYPGKDRFAFHVFERGRGYLLEFPNLTIGMCPELLNRLTNLIGVDNVRLEKITFQ